MIILKAFRSDKIVIAIENWITQIQGKEFIKAPSFNLERCFADSSLFTPLVFVLSSGSDPVGSFKIFAESMDMGSKY